MKRGYVVSNEYNNFQDSHYCGDCLDTYDDMQAYFGDDEEYDLAEAEPEHSLTAETYMGPGSRE